MADLLFDEMIKRAVEKNPDLPGIEPKMSPLDQARQSKPQSDGLSPKQALLLGSLADSASTAGFLARGREEGNPALQVFNKHPWTVAPAAVGGALGYNLLHKLISKKAPKIADTLAGGLGAFHADAAGNNIEPPYGIEKTVDDLILGKRNGR